MSKWTITTTCQTCQRENIYPDSVFDNAFFKFEDIPELLYCVQCSDKRQHLMRIAPDGTLTVYELS